MLPFPWQRGESAKKESSWRSLSATSQHARESPGVCVLRVHQSGRLSSETRAKILRAVDELGYVGNDAARQLRVGRSRALGLIVPNPLNPVFADVAIGAETAARARGQYVFVGNSAEDEEREREYIDFFESQRVGGIIIAPSQGSPNSSTNSRDEDCRSLSSVTSTNTMSTTR